MTLISIYAQDMRRYAPGDLRVLREAGHLGFTQW